MRPHEVSLRSLLLIAAVIFGAWLTIELVPILLVVVAALIFAGTLDPAVQWLERRRVGRLTAVTIVFSAAVLLIIGLGVLVGPPLADQLAQFVNDAPKRQAELAAWLGKSKMLSPAAAEVRKLNIGAIPFAKLVPAAGGMIEFLGYFASSVVLSLYLVLDRERSRALAYALTPRRHHVRLARILNRLGTIVGGYMRGQLITSVAIFVFTFILLTALGVEGALVFAVFAGLTDVIPFVGGLLATTPAVLGALSKSPGTGAIVLAAMLLYQEFESRILVPKIYGRTLRLSPATVILALLIGGKLLGIVGALLALPVAAALRMIIEEMRVELPGDASPHVERAAADARAEREYAVKTAGAGPEEAAEIAGQIADEGLKPH